MEPRCLFCLHWQPSGYMDERNRLAEERDMQRRQGPEVALAGGCLHPNRIRVGAASTATCPLWEPFDEGSFDDEPIR